MTPRELAEEIINNLDIQDTRANQIAWIESPLSRALEEVRATEREKCAKIAEKKYWDAKGQDEKAEEWLAAEIRRRGRETKA